MDDYKKSVHPLWVLNLVINGLPSIQNLNLQIGLESFLVLNLVINGLPSILSDVSLEEVKSLSFKPCYKWITFNTHSVMIFILE